MAKRNTLPPPAGPPVTAFLETLFRRPLITGASVSAGLGAESPGRRLSRRFTTPDQIVTVAVPGARGREIEPRLEETLLRDRTLVFAIDFFFWDSTDADPARSLSALDRLLEKTARRGIRLLLGDIPELLPRRQPGRDALNEAIHRQGAQTACGVLGLDELHRRLMREGSLKIGDRNYRFHELVPDGLHLADVGADYLSEKILEAVRGLH